MKIALIGYGRMGRAIEEIAAARGHEVVARLRSEQNAEGQGIAADRFADVEVALDFTQPEAVSSNIEGAAELGIDLVVGTTGWYEDLDRIGDLVDRAGIGLIYAPNFSLGTQIFFRLTQLVARLAERVEGYDAYVLEAHHRHKKDHPSGTARRLAEILVAELSSKTRWTEEPALGPRDPYALQVASLRAGANPGLHIVGLDGPDDQIELRHQARGRAGFARGAVDAAEWIRGRRGLFTIDDMLAEKFGAVGPEVP